VEVVAPRLHSEAPLIAAVVESWPRAIAVDSSSNTLSVARVRGRLFKGVCSNKRKEAVSLDSLVNSNSKMIFFFISE